MSTFQALEEARRVEGRRRESRVDEEGFVTVVRGPKAVKAGDGQKNGVEDAGDGGENKAKKSKGLGLEDFYRFQNREVRKERELRLMREFEKDRKRVEDMRRVRGRVRPE